MPAEAKTASPTVSELQRQIEALADQLRSQREECNEALQREAAIAEILRAINESGADLAPVFDVLIEKATQLCSASYGYVWLYDGERVRAVAAFAQQPFRDWLRDREPRIPPPQAPLGEAILHRRLVHVVDAREHEAYKTLAPYRELMDRGGIRTLLHVPLLKGDALLGLITVYRQERRPFSDRQIALLESFAAQAVIAIDNARLLNELRQRTRDLAESFEHQSATSAVLNVISRSPTDSQPVFEAIAESAARLCQAKSCHVYGFDGRLIHYMASYGHSPEVREALREAYPIAPGRGSCAARAILSAAVEQVPDVRADPDYAQGTIADLMKIRSIAAVPMLRADRPVGAIAITRTDPGVFPQRQIELLRTFAEQAVIALNNVRLFDEVQERARELQETLEQQIATADVLQVINASPGDLAPVFEAMLEKAMALCGAAFGFLASYDGRRFTPMAMRGVPPPLAEYFSRGMDQPCPGDAYFRVLQGEDVIHSIDQKDEEAYRSGSPFRRAAVDLGGARSALVVALRRDDAVLGALTIYRKEVRPFSDKQVALMRNFAAQAVVAIENARLLSQQREALEQQKATSEVLGVISSSPEELEPVFNSILSNAIRLCGAELGNLFLYDDRTFRVAAMQGASSAYAEAWRQQPVLSIEDMPHVPLARLAATKQVVHIPDLAGERTDLERDPRYVTLFESARARTMLLVPMLKEDELVGAIVIYAPEVRPFDDKHIDLVVSFAKQAVIAIENSRLLRQLRERTRDLEEALEYQTATSDVLQVISRSTFDLQPVLQTLADTTIRLCEAEICYIARRDGELFRVAAAAASSPQAAADATAYQRFLEAHPLSPGRGSLVGRIALEKRAVQIADVAADPEYVLKEAMTLGKIRTHLGVPLVREGSLIGAIILGRQRVAPFSDRHVDLLRTFADQAVIAIENTRLLTEQREALERQTATAEVLQVINSSPGNLAPVFDATLESATRLCGAAFGILWLCDGESFRAAALHGVPERYAEIARVPCRPLPGNPLGRMLRGERVIVSLDAAADEPYRAGDPVRRALVDLGGARSFIQVALFKDDVLLGSLTVYRQEVRPFSEKQIALLQSFAAQAVIAIENARLINETREALERQTATAEVLQVINSSPGNLAPVFETILEKAHALCGVAKGSLQLYDGEKFRAVAVRSLPELLARRLKEGQAPGPIGRRLLAGEDCVHVHELAEIDDPIARATAEEGGIKTHLTVALRKDSKLLGRISAGRTEVRPFTDKEIALLQSFAAQAVIAIENARLINETREALEQKSATAEILRVISTTPADPQPVFEMIVRSAVALCGGLFANVFRFDGELVHFVASHNTGPDYIDMLRARYPMRPDHSQVSGRVLLTKSVVRLADALADSDYDQRFPRALGWRRMLGMPMLRDGEPLGVIIVGWAEAGPVPKVQEELLKTFADQAVVAIENARLLAEQREALDQQTATAEVLEVINFSPGNLVPVFDAMLEKAMRLCEAAFGGLWTFDQDKYVVTALRGVPAPYAEFLANATMVPGPGTGPDRLKRGEPVVHNVDLAAEDAYRSGDPQRRALVDLGGARSAVQVPLRKDDNVLGVITIYRQEVRPFTDKQVALLQNFAAQAVIAIENARLITETREALDQQTATAEVLQVINSSPGDLAPVFGVMLEKAMRLCGATFGILRTYDGSLFHGAASRGVPAAYAEFLALNPQQPQPGSIGARIAAGEPLVHVIDVADDKIYPSSDPHRRALVELGGARTTLVVPLKGQRLLGAIQLYRREVRPFTDKEIALLRGFAAQAVIAMENARLLTEQREALERQTATAEVLQVINSSPGNLAPVFETILEKAHALCAVAYGSLQLFDGEKFRAVAVHGLPEPLARRLREGFAPGPNHPARRLIAGEDYVHLRDMAEIDDSVARATVEEGGIRTLLAVALRKDSKLLGRITAGRKEVRPFTDKEISLLQSFAAQAVIAMENARLLTEQREALEQQTATAEVLEVINSSPANLAPVFDAMLDRAVRLSESAFGIMNLYEDGRFKAVALRGVPPGLIERWETAPQPGPHNALSRLIAGEDVVHVADLAAYRSFLEGDPRSRALVEIGGARSLLAVALRKEGKLVGTLTAYRQEVRPFTDKQIALLESFAAQAVIAIENARLLGELRDRQAELRVTFDNMGDGVVMFDGDHRLAAWNRNFQELIGLSQEWLARRPSYADYLGLLAERGEFGTENVEAELASRLADPERELRLERTRPDGSVIEARRNAVPGGGFVLIYSDITERKRSEERIRAARDVAETALKELKTAQASLIHAEKMASLGQLAAGIAHEIKNPLNFVNNFAGLSMELLEELKESVVEARQSLDEDKRAALDETVELLSTNLDKIGNHGRRADGIVKSMLLHSRGGSSDRQTVDINTVLEEALNLAYHGARAQDQSFNVTPERELQGDMAPIEVVPQDITRVFLNLIGNAFYAVAKRRRQEGETFRPTVKVTTRDLPDAVEIVIHDNGVGIPPHHRQRLFQPFFTTKPTGEGTGLGLSISYDIVTQQHGGTIVVDSAPGQFTEFAIRLPRRGPSAAAAGRPA